MLPFASRWLLLLKGGVSSETMRTPASSWASSSLTSPETRFVAAACSRRGSHCLRVPDCRFRGSAAPSLAGRWQALYLADCRLADEGGVSRLVLVRVPLVLVAVGKTTPQRGALIGRGIRPCQRSLKPPSDGTATSFGADISPISPTTRRALHFRGFTRRPPSEAATSSTTVVPAALHRRGACSSHGRWPSPVDPTLLLLADRESDEAPVAVQLGSDASTGPDACSIARAIRPRACWTRAGRAAGKRLSQCRSSWRSGVVDAAS